jgi:hypothetical protein
LPRFACSCCLAPTFSSCPYLFPSFQVIAHLPPHFPFRFLFVCFLTVVRTAA